MIRYIPVASSTIERVGYDVDTMELRVFFKSGAHYSYPQVPAFKLVQVLFAESVGSAFDSVIKKGGFAYTKIEPVANQQQSMTSDPWFESPVPEQFR